MSFIIQLFNAPAATTFAQADAYINQATRTGANNDRFASFIQRVLLIYPDDKDGASDVVDEDGESGDSCAVIWSEPLPFAPFLDDVLNLGLKTECIDAATLDTLAHLAVDVGLQMLEPIGATLYRADRTLVDDAGQVEPFAPPVSRAKAKASAKPELPGAPEVLAHLTACLLETLTPHGFRQSTPRVDQSTLLVREDPDVQQLIQLRCTPSGSKGNWCHYMFEFRAPKLRLAWQGAMQERYNAFMQRVPDFNSPDLTYFMDDFSLIQDEQSLWLNAHAHIKTHKDLRTYGEHLHAWLQGHRLHLLNNGRDLKGLIRLATDQRRLAQLILSPDSLQGLWTEAALLTLALWPTNPRAALWIEAVRYKHAPDRWKQAFGDDKDECFGQIVAHLQQNPLKT